MELALEPELYIPSINDSGNYVDKVPSFRHGMTCPCGSRKDKIYDTPSKFKSHCKGIIHQKWLNDLNMNRANYYVQSVQLEDIVKQQRIVIAQFEKELHIKSKTIDLLTERLLPKQEIGDLIGWD